MGFFAGRTINDIIALGQFLEQAGRFFGRILKIIVHGDNDVVARRANAAEQRIVLSVIPHQVYPDNTLMGLRQRLNDFPALVPAAIVYENDLDDALAARKYQE